MIERIIRVFKLDASVFREIAEDKGTMMQAAIIVVLVHLISGLGAGIGTAIAKSGSAVGTFFLTWISGVLLSWILWAVLTYFVGTMLFQGKTDIPEMLRVLGYANAPALLGVFAIIPCLGWIAALVGGILALIAGFLAVREAMDFDTTKAIITVVIAWVISFAVSFAVSAIL
jgi:hypothetical protein